MQSLPLKIFIALVSCMLLWFGCTGLRNKEVYIRGGRWIRRNDSPFQYWSNVIAYLVAGLGGLLYAFFPR